MDFETVPLIKKRPRPQTHVRQIIENDDADLVETTEEGAKLP